MLFRPSCIKNVSQRYLCSEQRLPSHFCWKAKSLHQLIGLSVQEAGGGRRRQESRPSNPQHWSPHPALLCSPPASLAVRIESSGFYSLRSGQELYCMHTVFRVKVREGENRCSWKHWGNISKQLFCHRCFHYFEMFQHMMMTGVTQHYPDLLGLQGEH